MLRRPRSVLAVKYVETATITVSRPFAKEEAGLMKDFPMFWAASTTKMKEIKVEKISSVKRVRYLTKFEADVMELIIPNISMIRVK